MARYSRKRRLKLLVQAYAFIGLAAIVSLLLSSAEVLTLRDHSSLEAEGRSEAGLFSRLRSMLSVTGAAVGESAEEGLPEAQDNVPGAVAEPQPEVPEQFTLAFKPAEATSLTTLATSGETHVGTVTLFNNGGEASNVKLSVRSPDGLFTPKERKLGTLEGGESRSEELSLDFSEEAVGYGLASEATVLLRFALGFADADNFLHQHSYSSTLPVLGRRVAEDAPRGYARFVPQSDPVIERFVAEHLGGVRAKDTLESQRLSARWIFESLQSLDFEMLPDSQHEVRFPAESLSERTATPTDLAVLYAALLHSAGFDAALISTEGRLLPAYVDPRPQRYIVPLVPDAPDYEEALNRSVALLKEGPYSTTVLEDVWGEFPSAKFPSGKLSIGEWPSMTRQVGRCALEPLAAGISKAKVPVRLSNTGTAVGIGCVGLVSYESDQRSGTVFECYTVSPGLVRDTELSTLVVGNSPSCEGI